MIIDSWYYVNTIKRMGWILWDLWSSILDGIFTSIWRRNVLDYAVVTMTWWLEALSKLWSSCYKVWIIHPPGSKSWHSEAVRPSLAELAIPSTYWGWEEDLDIEYSLVFQKMSFQCWPAVCDVGSPVIQPSRTFRWDVAVCVWDVSGELLGQQTCVV